MSVIGQSLAIRFLYKCQYRFHLILHIPSFVSAYMVHIASYVGAYVQIAPFLHQPNRLIPPPIRQPAHATRAPAGNKSGRRRGPGTGQKPWPRTHSAQAKASGPAGHAASNPANPRHSQGRRLTASPRRHPARRLRAEPGRQASTRPLARAGKPRAPPRASPPASPPARRANQGESRHGMGAPAPA